MVKGGALNRIREPYPDGNPRSVPTSVVDSYNEKSRWCRERLLPCTPKTPHFSRRPESLDRALLWHVLHAVVLDVSSTPQKSPAWQQFRESRTAAATTRI